MTRLTTDHPAPAATPPSFVRAAAPLPGLAQRLTAAVVFLLCAGVLIVAWRLNPNPRGMQTHHQLGLPPCGFLAATGIPCATCGMTTAFSHAAHGHFLAALRTQPAGALLALATAAATLVSGYALVTGMSLAPLARWLWRAPIVWAAGGLLVAAWIYKIILTLASP